LRGAEVHGRHCCGGEDQVPMLQETHVVPESVEPATQANGQEVALTPGPVHVALVIRPVHAWHAVAPGADEKVPLGHAAHATLLIAYAPAVQLAHGVYPYDTDPLGQDVQEDNPAALAYVPEEHAMQRRPADENEPTGHGRHSDAVELQNTKRPGGQETQETHSCCEEEVSLTRIAKGSVDVCIRLKGTTVEDGSATNEAPPTDDGKYSWVAPRSNTPIRAPPGARVVTARVERSTFRMLPGH